MNSENAAATKRCKAGSQAPHCHNTTDIYNPQDVATLRINSDYGKKERREAKAPYTLLSSGPLKVHSGAQFIEGSGKKHKKRGHPQQKLLDLAMKTIQR